MSSLIYFNAYKTIFFDCVGSAGKHVIKCTTFIDIKHVFQRSTGPYLQKNCVLADFHFYIYSFQMPEYFYI